MASSTAAGSSANPAISISKLAPAGAVSTPAGASIPVKKPLAEPTAAAAPGRSSGAGRGELSGGKGKTGGAGKVVTPEQRLHNALRTVLRVRCGVGVLGWRGCGVAVGMGEGARMVGMR